MQHVAARLRLKGMRKYWILTSLGLLSIATALAIGFTPVHSSLLIAATENGPGGHPSISCGSALIKRPPTYSAPFTGMRLRQRSVQRGPRPLPAPRQDRGRRGAGAGRRGFRRPPGDEAARGIPVTGPG